MGHYLVERLSVDLEPLAGGGIPAHTKVFYKFQFIIITYLGGFVTHEIKYKIAIVLDLECSSVSGQRRLSEAAWEDHVLCSAQTIISRFIDQFVKSVYRR